MREFWSANSGVTPTQKDKAYAFAADAEARALTDSSSLTAGEVSKALGVPLTTILDHAAPGILYTYVIGDHPVFPEWQFNEARNATVPFLASILRVLPSDIHRQTVAGFFLTPEPDLVVNGRPSSVKTWLEEGGSTDPVMALAETLAAGY